MWVHCQREAHFFSEKRLCWHLRILSEGSITSWAGSDLPLKTGRMHIFVWKLVGCVWTYLNASRTCHEWWIPVRHRHVMPLAYLRWESRKSDCSMWWQAHAILLSLCNSACKSVDCSWWTIESYAFFWCPGLLLDKCCTIWGMNVLNDRFFICRLINIIISYNANYGMTASKYDACNLSHRTKKAAHLPWKPQTHWKSIRVQHALFIRCFQHPSSCLATRTDHCPQACLTLCNSIEVQTSHSPCTC